MLRSRVGSLVRPAVAAMLSSVRWESTPGAAASAVSSSSSPSSSFSRKMRMATAGGGTAATVTAAAAEAEPTRKIVKKKKVIRRVVRKANGETVTVTVPAQEAVNHAGDRLRRELRGYDTAETEATAPTQKAQKTSLVKGYKIDEITSVCTPSDAVFARRLPAGGCQFFAWPGTPLEVASAAIVSMPDTIRTVHAVFGRHKTPIDLVMDVDCPVPQEHWSMSKIRPFQEKLLDSTLSVVAEELAKIGETIETQVVLQSPNLKKASFHIHTKLKDAAFEDYNALHGFLARFHDRIPTVDLQIYRANGMLRMFSCMKENHTSAMTVFDGSRWNIGFEDGAVPDEAAALHSVIVRPVGTFRRLIKFDPPRHAYNTLHQHSTGAASASAASANADAVGDKSSEHAIYPVVLMPRTEREAVANASRWLRSATEVEVGEWRSWIGLGLCAFRLAYHFRDADLHGRPAMDEMLDAWVEASRHCPTKFRQGDCEQRWASFDIEKLTGQSDWWSAYMRLGKLEVPAKESIAEQEARRTAATSKRKK